MSDFEDILPRNVNPDTSQPGAFRTFIWRCAYTLIAGLVTAVAGRLLLEKWRVYQNKNYRLAQRRRHGIPDDDHRPFNVAVADVNIQRQEAARQTAKQKAEQAQALRQRVLTEQAQQQQQSRQRGAAAKGYELHTQPRYLYNNAQQAYSPNVSRQGTPSFVNTPSFPASSSQNHSLQNPANHVTFADGYNTSNVAIGTSAAGGPQQPRRHNTSILKTSVKRSHEDEEDEYDDDDDITKRSRREGGELIDGDEEPEWAGKVRGAKRGSEEEHGRSKGKRQRKVSLETDEGFDEEMDVDPEEEDEVGEIQPPVRGKKRGRTSANFDHDRPSDEDNEKRIGKRRNRKTSDVHLARGKKRDRDGEEDVAEVLETPQKSSKKKKGRTSRVPQDLDIDTAMDDETSPKPEKQREIGERWTANGVNYKIGPNAQKLREAFVHEDRPKYTMPADSDHADSKINVRYVWREWLTEEEYEEAKAQGRLSHPDELESQPSTPTIAQASPAPVRNGKRLLWQSATASPLVKQEEKSASPLSSAPASPKPYSSRRITMTGLADSTNAIASPRRVYTKWEKQDMEAQALERVRKAAKGKEAAKPAIAPAPSATSLPAITLTKPAEESKPTTPAAPATGFSFGPSSGSSNPLFKKPEDKKEESGAAAAAAPAPTAQEKPKQTGLGFGFPSSLPKPGVSSTQENKSQAAPTSAPASTPTPTSAPASNNFFGKPAAPAPSAPAPSATPNFFAKPSTSPAPASQPAPPPNGFFGAKPAGAPAVPASSASNPLMSRLGGFAGSTPTANGSTAPAEKQQQPAPSPAPAPASSSGPPKFSFGFDKPSSTTTASAPAPAATTSSSDSSKPAVDAAKTQPSPPKPLFSFNMNKTDTAKPKEGSAPPALFGGAGATGSTTPFGTPADASKPKEGSAPPAFTGFGGLGSNTAQSSSNGSAGGSLFGGANPAFGSAPSQGSDANKKEDKPDASKEAPKPSFSFGPTGNSSTQGSTKSAFGGFGSPASSPFGASSTPATEKKDDKPAAGAPASVFGAATSATQPSSNSPKPFSFGGGGSAPSPFGAGSSSAPKPLFGVASSDASKSNDAPKPFGSAPAQSSPLKSAFGPSDVAKSPFGSPAPSSSTDAPKSAFGPAASTSSGEAPKSAFGGASAFGSGDSSKSPFGSATQSGEGAKSLFGSATAANNGSSTSEQPKSMFGSSGFAPASSGDTPKPSFSFGGSSGSFSFGSNNNSTGNSASGSQESQGSSQGSTGSTSLFGGAKSGGFNFGTPSSSTPFGSPAPEKSNF